MPVIATNNAANSALNYLNNNSTQEANRLAKLASGSRIVQASDDAAGLAIGTQLQASVTTYNQNVANVQQGSAILQTADGALAQISNILQRMMSLATEAGSGQVTNAQRSQDINTEYSQLQAEITSISSSTRYAGQAVLSGSFLSQGVKFLVGTTSSDSISVTVTSVSLASLGVTGSVTTAASALAAITAINSAINMVSQDRAKIGAYESRFNFSLQDLQTNILNISSAQSVIMDADVASVKAELSSIDVKTQASVAALTQAAQLPTELLKLIQG